MRIGRSGALRQSDVTLQIPILDQGTDISKKTTGACMALTGFLGVLDVWRLLRGKNRPFTGRNSRENRFKNCIFLENQGNA